MDVCPAAAVDLARIVYEALKLCPRVHGTIKKTIMRGLFGDYVELREVTKQKDDGIGTYQALEIHEKVLSLKDRLKK